MRPSCARRKGDTMSALSEHAYLAEEICELYSRLTGEAYVDDTAKFRKLADGGNPHDHWLHTTRLDYESRLFLYMAAAFAMRCMGGEPYKCAVFMRSAAEALAQTEA